MYDFPLIWFKIRDYVTAALAISLVVTTTGWYVTDLNLKNEKLGRKNDLIKFEKSMKDAEVEHLKQKAEKERQYEDLKAKGDRDYAALLSKYDAALLHYKANTGTASYTNLPRSTEGARSTPRVAEDSFVPVRESDLLICAENTAKVVVMYDWLKNLDSLKETEDASQKRKK